MSVLFGTIIALLRGTFGRFRYVWPCLSYVAFEKQFVASSLEDFEPDYYGGAGEIEDLFKLVLLVFRASNNSYKIVMRPDTRASTWLVLGLQESLRESFQNLESLLRNLQRPAFRHYLKSYQDWDLDFRLSCRRSTTVYWYIFLPQDYAHLQSSLAKTLSLSEYSLLLLSLFYSTSSSATRYLVIILAKWDLCCCRDGNLDRLGYETIVVFVTWDFGCRSSSSQRVVFTCGTCGCPLSVIYTPHLWNL